MTSVNCETPDNCSVMDLCNTLIEDRIIMYGMINTIQYLLDYGFSSSDLIEKFRFDQNEIDAAIADLDKDECDNCGMSGRCETCCKTCGKPDCTYHNPEYEDRWKNEHPDIYAEIMKNSEASEN